MQIIFEVKETFIGHIHILLVKDVVQYDINMLI